MNQLANSLITEYLEHPNDRACGAHIGRLIDAANDQNNLDTYTAELATSLLLIIADHSDVHGRLRQADNLPQESIVNEVIDAARDTLSYPDRVLDAIGRLMSMIAKTYGHTLMPNISNEHKALVASHASLIMVLIMVAAEYTKLESAKA